MSIRLPDVRLDGGIFTYEDNLPVFIDDSGTRHYDKGESMRKLFSAGMSFQRARDSEVMAVRDRQIDHLNGQLTEVRQVADRNFELGSKLQLAHDKKVLAHAYTKGREDQAFEDREKMFLAYQQGVDEQNRLSSEVVVKITRENRDLRASLAQLSAQVEKSRRVADLHLSPRSTRRESPFHNEQKKDVINESQDVAEVAEVQEVKGDHDGEECQDFPLASTSNQKQQSNPEELSSSARLDWLCTQLKENSRFPWVCCVIPD